MELRFHLIQIIFIISRLGGFTARLCTDEYALEVNEASGSIVNSILNPYNVNEFINNYFETSPMLAKRPNNPKYYGNLISIDDVKSSIDEGYQLNRPSQHIQYLKDWKLARQELRNNEYWTGVFDNNNTTLTGSIAFKAMDMHHFTLIMNRIQSIFPSVFFATQHIEDYLGWQVNANLYVTPPGGNQGFEAHFDWMDGFVLQLSGSKVWTMYDPPLVHLPRPDLVQKPTRQFLRNRMNDNVINEDNTPQKTLNKPSHMTLQAGDLAYIPRGFVHEAISSTIDIDTSSQDISIHVTMGLEIATRYSVEVHNTLFIIHIDALCYVYNMITQYSPYIPSVLFHSF